MGLLEDLERQAQQRRREEELSAEELERRRAHFRDTVRPAAGRVYEYLREVTNHINYLKPEKTTDFEVPRYGKIQATIVPEFRIKVSKDDDQASFTIDNTMEIPLDSSPEVFIESESLVRDMENALLGAGVSARQVRRRDAAGNIIASTFQVSGKIKRIAVIRCQVLDPEIHFEFYNFGTLGKHERHFRPEAIDDRFLDRLGRFVIGDNADFLRDIHDEDDLNRIRERIRDRERSGPVLRERDPEPREGLLDHLRELWSKAD